MSTSFRSYARDALFPKDAFGRVVLALVALRTPIVWMVSWLVRREPIAVTAMYRPGGDVQYFELAGAFGRGNLGESNVFELAGQGIHPFPLGSIWFHSLCVGIAGPWGMLFADTVVTALAFAAIAVLARACSLSARGAAAFGGFVVGYVYIPLFVITDRLGWGRDLFWGDRFPRPFLTEIFVALSLAALVRVWTARGAAASGPAASEAAAGVHNGGDGAGAGVHKGEGEAGVHKGALPPLFWGFAGVAYSLLLQSDIYAAFIVGLVYAAVLGHRLVTEPARRKETLVGAAIMVAVLIATAWPFALQRARSTQELLVRWGVYPLSRGAALSWIRYTPLAGPAVVALAAGAVWAWARRSAGVAASGARRLATYWCVATGVTVLAFPLFFAILGQGLYPYMFPDRLRRIAMWSAAFIVLPAVAAWWRERAAKGPAAGSLAPGSARLAKVLGGALVVAMVGGIAVRAVEMLRKEDHVRTWYKFGKGVAYRTAFSELVRELEKPEHRSSVVLGTLDQQVHVHWQTWVGGRSFVPDGFVSIAPDADIERRFALFCRTVGVPEEEFLELLSEPSHNGLLFVSKYGTNRAYAMSPLADYTEAQQKAIQGRGQFVSFSFEVSRPEKERFRQLYADPKLGENAPRLDLVVMTNEGRYGKYAPPASDFELKFENAVFRLYARRPPGS